MRRTETWYLCYFDCEPDLHEHPDVTLSGGYSPNTDPVHTGSIGDTRVMVHSNSNIVAIKDTPRGSIEDEVDGLSYEGTVRVSGEKIDELLEEIEQSDFELLEKRVQDGESRQEFDSITEALNYSEPVYLSELRLSLKDRELDLLDFGKVHAEESIHIPELIQILGRL